MNYSPNRAEARPWCTRKMPGTQIPSLQSGRSFCQPVGPTRNSIHLQRTGRQRFSPQGSCRGGAERESGPCSLCRSRAQPRQAAVLAQSFTLVRLRQELPGQAALISLGRSDPGLREKLLCCLLRGGWGRGENLPAEVEPNLGTPIGWEACVTLARSQAERSWRRGHLALSLCFAGSGLQGSNAAA